ncbi:MAG: hypothetical protein ACR5KX_00640 [Wolbachia sp.]
MYDRRDKLSKGKAGEVAYCLTLDGKLVTHEHIVPYSNSGKKLNMDITILRCLVENLDNVLV